MKIFYCVCFSDDEVQECMAEDAVTNDINVARGWLPEMQKGNKIFRITVEEEVEL